jgi:hypothetical protein
VNRLALSAAGMLLLAEAAHMMQGFFEMEEA